MILIWKGFFKKYNLEDDAVNESELKRVYNYHINRRDSKIRAGRCFINIDKGVQDGSHWTDFYVKDTNFFDFDSLEGPPEKFLLNQLPKPMSFHNYKI